MPLLLIWLAAFSGLELSIWLRFVWPSHKPLAAVLIIGLAIVSGLFFGAQPHVWSAIVLVLSIYRIVNLLRLVEGRIQPDFLYHSAKRSSLLLIALQVTVLSVAYLNRLADLPVIAWVYSVAGLQLLAALIFLWSVMRQLVKSTPPAISRHYADRDLPTVSVAIPARNETDDLEACLRSLVGSTYPKLEILVLDDCSQLKRTPEIIRQFAHDGIRFIDGKTPPKHWLAKNYAYQQLADAASGEVLLFCGVDTRFQPDSVRSMVEVMLSKKKTMLSFLPKNELDHTRLESIILQAGRYAWELALPRRQLQRPPVLSTCWLVTAQVLHAAGSFKAITNTSSIESYFARYAINHDDGYSFLQSTPAIGLTCQKTLSEQRATAVRTRYPQLHRRPELVALVTIAETVLLAGPFVLLIWALIEMQWSLAELCAVSSGLLLVHFSKIVDLTYRRFVLSGVWLLPFAAIYDVILLNNSMWQYEFKEVIWKNRNVCIPIMRVVPKLPELD